MERNKKNENGFVKFLRAVGEVADGIAREGAAQDRENRAGELIVEAREKEEDAKWEWEYGSKLKSMALKMEAQGLRDRARQYQRDAGNFRRA